MSKSPDFKALIYPGIPHPPDPSTPVINLNDWLELFARMDDAPEPVQCILRQILDAFPDQRQFYVPFYTPLEVLFLILEAAGLIPKPANIFERDEAGKHKDVFVQTLDNAYAYLFHEHTTRPTQEDLSDYLNISVDTIRRRLGGRGGWKTFQDNFRPRW
jgi:hypothetical protein